MKNKIDLLDLEYSSRGRDIDIVEPALSYLELKYHLKIKRKWLYYNCIFDILYTRPKALIIANGIGSFEHYCAVKFASLLGIKVITFISEGDYSSIKTKEDTEQFFWGWNKEHIAYEDLNLQWSSDSIKLIEKYIPLNCRKNLNIRLSGATGFDKYRLLQNFLKKDDFLRKYKLKQYNKIIGIAGWGFGLFSGDYFKKNKEVFSKVYTEYEISNYQESLSHVQNGYRKIIENNPDTLFILKLHPVGAIQNISEFKNLDIYQNTVYIHTEENIYDIINTCDLWIAFDSTTCMEAWLLNKPTLLYNPLGSDFKRSIISQGSPIIQDWIILDNCIKEYFTTSVIKIFDDLAWKRETITRAIIGYDDGKCFIHASEFIIELLDAENKKTDSKKFFEICKLFCKGIRDSLRNIITRFSIFAFIPIIKKYRIRSKNARDPLYNHDERIVNANIYKEAIKKYLSEGYDL
jgi:hypothetical protein